MMAETFQKDPHDWLRKWSPREWIQLALGELRRAEEAYKGRDTTAGLAGCRRAAGMALNAALIVEPKESWGRSYVDHVRALARDETVPPQVRAACQRLVDAQPPSPHFLTLRLPGAEDRLIESARDVMAHAYAVVMRHDMA
jgi:HEPN domain-containing protein